MNETSLVSAAPGSELAAAVAVVTVAVVAVAAHACSPRRLRGGSFAAATFALAGLLILAVAPGTPAAVCFGLPLSLLPAFSIVDPERSPRSSRLALTLALIGSCPAFLVAFLPGFPARSDDGVATFAMQAASVISVLPLLVRLGVFPFHVWLPVLLEEAPLPVAWLVAATPVVPILSARWLLPTDPAGVAAIAPMLLAFGVVSALYGSVLALVQPRLKRMLGYLMVSQAGTMLTSLALGAPGDVAGTWLAAIAYGVPMGALLALASAIHARTGTDEIVRLGGLISPTPHLGAAFLVLGFAAVGFPGSLAFVAEDMMMHVVLAAHSWAGALLLLATALNAIAVFRCFQKVFFGPLPRTRVLDRVPDLVVRERAVVVVLAALVVLTGVFPGPFVDLAHRASGRIDSQHGEAH